LQTFARDVSAFADEQNFGICIRVYTHLYRPRVADNRIACRFNNGQQLPVGPSIQGRLDWSRTPLSNGQTPYITERGGGRDVELFRGYARRTGRGKAMIDSTSGIFTRVLTPFPSSSPSPYLFNVYLRSQPPARPDAGAIRKAHVYMCIYTVSVCVCVCRYAKLFGALYVTLNRLRRIIAR